MYNGSYKLLVSDFSSAGLPSTGQQAISQRWSFSGKDPESACH